MEVSVGLGFGARAGLLWGIWERAFCHVPGWLGDFGWPVGHYLSMYLYLLMSHGDVDDVVYGLPLYEVWGVI